MIDLHETPTCTKRFVQVISAGQRVFSTCTKPPLPTGGAPSVNLGPSRDGNELEFIDPTEDPDP